MDDIPQKVTPRLSPHLLFINNLRDVCVKAAVQEWGNDEVIFYSQRPLKRWLTKSLPSDFNGLQNNLLRSHRSQTLKKALITKRDGCKENSPAHVLGDTEGVPRPADAALGWIGQGWCARHPYSTGPVLAITSAWGNFSLTLLSEELCLT